MTRLYVLGGVLALAVPVLGAVVPEQVIQEKVEALRSGSSVRIGDATIASTMVLPTFYERRGFRPAWTSPAAAEALLQAIRESAADGLDPADYHSAAIERLRSASEGAEAQAELDLLFTDALIRLAYHLRFGKVDPELLDPNWNFTRDLQGVEPAAALEKAITDGRLHETIEGLKPTLPFYAALKNALAEYRRMEAAGGWQPTPPGATLKPGMTDARVAILRGRLAVTGDLPADAAAGQGPLFDTALAAAVRAFQERHGLPADGVVGATTVQAMNVPVGQRIDQIRATLERCRWVMHDVPDRFVLVNVAGFEVYYLKDGQRIWESPVVVGKPYTRTPIFRADMTYIVLNPTWTVPPSILKKEILPGMARDPKYLEKKGLRMVDGRAVQPAGPNNALGRIKLMFPNSHSVYLHDTPQRSLFAETSRTFSHGCVRVQKPFELAALVLDDPAWTTGTLNAAAATGATRTILLQRPLPVLILYWTAAVGRDGRTYFLPDVYGRDPAIIHGLAGGFSFGKRPVMQPSAVRDDAPEPR